MPPKSPAADKTPVEAPKKRAVAKVEFSRPQEFYGSMLSRLVAGERTDPLHTAGPSIATPAMHVDLSTNYLHIGQYVYPLPHPDVRRFIFATAAPAPAKESPTK